LSEVFRLVLFRSVFFSGKNFHEDPISNYYVNLLTDRQTNLQTPAR